MLALTQREEWWFVAALPYAYLFGLAGIPAYFLFKRLQWLTFSRVILGGAAIGALISLLFFGSSGSIAVVRFAGLGALTAAVFWAIAYVGKPPTSDA